MIKIQSPAKQIPPKKLKSHLLWIRGGLKDQTQPTNLVSDFAEPLITPMTLLCTLSINQARAYLWRVKTVKMKKSSAVMPMACNTISPSPARA